LPFESALRAVTRCFVFRCGLRHLARSAVAALNTSVPHIDELGWPLRWAPSQQTLAGVLDTIGTDSAYLRPASDR
jgi:hypothetical protein